MPKYKKLSSHDERLADLVWWVAEADGEDAFGALSTLVDRYCHEQRFTAAQRREFLSRCGGPSDGLRVVA